MVTKATDNAVIMHTNPIKYENAPGEQSCEQLKRGLANAGRKVRNAALLEAACTAVRQFFAVTAVAFVTSSLVLLLGKAVGYSLLSPAISLILLVSVASCVRALVAFESAWRVGSTWDEVAQRLDLAVGNHNAIATALDLARSARVSPMVDRAIASGLSAAYRYADVDPLPASRKIGSLQSAGILLLTIGLFVVAFVIPESTARRVVSSLSMNAKLSAIPGTDTNLTASQLAEVDGAKRVQNLPSSQTRGSKTDNAIAANSATAADTNGIGFPGQNTTAGSASTASRGNSKPRSAPNVADADSDPLANRSTLNKQQSAAAGAGDSSNQSSGTGDPNGAAAQSDSNPTATEETADRHNEPVGMPNDGMGLLPDDKSKTVSKQSEGTGSPKMTGSRGTGNGSSTDQSGDQSGPNGRSGGKNSPKKSRGVAALMLGSRQADLIKGRPLPGPDQRSPMQMQPMPLPSSPAIDVTAVPRQDPEPATNVFHVSSEERTTVDDYFANLHSDATLR